MNSSMSWLHRGMAPVHVWLSSPHAKGADSSPGLCMMKYDLCTKPGAHVSARCPEAVLRKWHLKPRWTAAARKAEAWAETASVAVARL